MRNRRTVCYAFCYSDEENGRCTCASGDLTTANQSEIRKAYLVSVVSGRKFERRERKMAKKENAYKGYDITTQAVHTGTGYDQETGAVRRPLHMANSYKLPDDLS